MFWYNTAILTSKNNSIKNFNCWSQLLQFAAKNRVSIKTLPCFIYGNTAKGKSQFGLELETIFSAVPQRPFTQAQFPYNEFNFGKHAHSHHPTATVESFLHGARCCPIACYLVYQACKLEELHCTNDILTNTHNHRVSLLQSRRSYIVSGAVQLHAFSLPSTNWEELYCMNDILANTQSPRPAATVESFLHCAGAVK